MYETLKTLSGKAKQETENERFIREMFEDLIGSPPPYPYYECRAHPGCYCGYQLITGRKRGLTTGIGYYVQQVSELYYRNYRTNWNTCIISVSVLETY
jgi:hypothetical protein